MTIANRKILVLSVLELTELCSQSLQNIQTHYQKLLTNALSHERITPINSIINLTEVLLNKHSMKRDSSFFKEPES